MRTKARWSLQDAKAQFSEVVRRSIADGPQIVSKNGADAVVILSIEEFGKLQPPTNVSLARTLAESPLHDVSIDVRRPRNAGRVIKL